MGGEGRETQEARDRDIHTHTTRTVYSVVWQKPTQNCKAIKLKINKWQPTPVFLPGKPHRKRSLAGGSRSPWGQKRLGYDLVTKQQILLTELGKRMKKHSKNVTTNINLKRNQSKVKNTVSEVKKKTRNY